MDTMEFDWNIEDDPDEAYCFNPSDLDEDDEEIRGWAVMAISREKRLEYENRLLEIVDNDNSLSVRRHAVRGLGNLSSKKAIHILMKIIDSEQGLIVGDAITSLGQLGAKQAISKIELLTTSTVPWVSQQARYVLKTLHR